MYIHVLLKSPGQDSALQMHPTRADQRGRNTSLDLRKPRRLLGPNFHPVFRDLEVLKANLICANWGKGSIVHLGHFCVICLSYSTQGPSCWDTCRSPSGGLSCPLTDSSPGRLWLFSCYSCMLRQHLYIPHRLPIPTPTSSDASFIRQCFSRTSLSKKTSCHLCLAFCKSGWTALKLQRGDPCKISKLTWTSFLCRPISYGIHLSSSLSRLLTKKIVTASLIMLLS